MPRRRACRRRWAPGHPYFDDSPPAAARRTRGPQSRELLGASPAASVPRRRPARQGRGPYGSAFDRSRAIRANSAGALRLPVGEGETQTVQPGNDVPDDDLDRRLARQLIEAEGAAVADAQLQRGLDRHAALGDVAHPDGVRPFDRDQRRRPVDDEPGVLSLVAPEVDRAGRRDRFRQEGYPGRKRSRRRSRRPAARPDCGTDGRRHRSRGARPAGVPSSPTARCGRSCGGSRAKSAGCRVARAPCARRRGTAPRLPARSPRSRCRPPMNRASAARAPAPCCRSARAAA